MRVEGNALIVSTGDVLRLSGNLWEVTGVHIGAQGQEDIYEIVPMVQLASCEGPALLPRAILEHLIRSRAATGYTPLIP